MFTLARSPVEEWGRDRVLEMIRQVGDGRGDFKLIVSLRTEYYGRLVSALASRPGRGRRRARVPPDRPRRARDGRRDPPPDVAGASARTRPKSRSRSTTGSTTPKACPRRSPARSPATAAPTASPCSCRSSAPSSSSVPWPAMTTGSPRTTCARSAASSALSRHVKRQIDRLLPGNSAHVGFDAQVNNLHRIVTEGRPTGEFVEVACAALTALRDPRNDRSGSRCF